MVLYLASPRSSLNVLGCNLLEPAALLHCSELCTFYFSLQGCFQTRVILRSTFKVGIVLLTFTEESPKRNVCMLICFVDFMQHFLISKVLRALRCPREIFFCLHCEVCCRLFVAHFCNPGWYEFCYVILQHLDGLWLLHCFWLGHLFFASHCLSATSSSLWQTVLTVPCVTIALVAVLDAQRYCFQFFFCI